MKYMLKTKTTKNKIIIFFVVIAFIIIGLIFAFIIFKHLHKHVEIKETPKSDVSAEISSNENPILNVPNLISLDKLETYKFTYSTKYADDYDINVTVEDENIIQLDKNYNIIPNSVGITYIKVEINCNPKISKTTIVSVDDAVTDITYKFLDSDNLATNNFYVGETYYLEITENVNINLLPNIVFKSTHVSNFSFVSKHQNILLYQFKIIKNGNFSFEYSPKHSEYTKYINICSYVYPYNFDVLFSNVNLQNNEINLYLFNNEYKSEANNAGFFNSFSFETKIIEGSNDVINYSISNDCVSLNNNSVTANKEGSSVLYFESLISNVKKEYVINVIKINPSFIIFNNNNYSIGETITFDLDTNIESNFNLELFPIYSFNQINITTSNGINISNNKIIRTNSSEQTIEIYNSNTLLLKIIIPEIKTYSIKICLNNSSTEIKDNSIKFNSDFLMLYCEIIDNKTNTSINNQLFISINDETILQTSTGSNKVTNGYITFEILKSGKTEITIFNKTLNVSKRLIIEID